ncbi:MAG: hypothetical protein QG608_2160 [Actinomycetota bacterium]|nr:hypothetical protein [Actinomycetota bacterium]
MGAAGSRSCRPPTGGRRLRYGAVTTSADQVAENTMIRWYRSWSASVVPAHAGVVPRRAWSRTSWTCRPRPRGGGPAPRQTVISSGTSSPPTRGWSGNTGPGPPRRPVVPAHAGVVRSVSTPAQTPASRPRPRGGGPSSTAPAVRPRRSSPPTRGWSARRLEPVADQLVVPAHAGVVPHGSVQYRKDHSRPRPRGGGPRTSSGENHLWGVVPAHAGVVPGAGFVGR